jgi:hypothetical protein
MQAKQPCELSSHRLDHGLACPGVEGKDLLAEHGGDGIGRPVSLDPTRTTHFRDGVSGNQLFLVKEEGSKRATLGVRLEVNCLALGF